MLSITPSSFAVSHFFSVFFSFIFVIAPRNRPRRDKYPRLFCNGFPTEIVHHFFERVNLEKPPREGSFQPNCRMRSDFKTFREKSSFERPSFFSGAMRRACAAGARNPATPRRKKIAGTPAKIISKKNLCI